MNVILAMVMSADGKTTKWNNPQIYEWTSKEDQKYFFSLIKKHKVIIMGRKTFDAAQSIMKLSPKRLRIVLTKNPNRYKKPEVPGQLEFTNDSPAALLSSPRAKGYSQVLLVGGGYTNAQFFKTNLINEVWLTIEHVIFGMGNNVTTEEKLHVNMELKSVKKLNKYGTILLKYRVVKPSK